MIIGISGKKQSGKNTVALMWQYLYSHYNNNYTHPITVKDFKEYVKNNHHLKSVWIQKSFAHKIKQITCILLGCTMEQLEDPKFKESTLGEEWWVIKLPSSGIIPYLGDYPPFYKKYDVIKLTPRMLMQMLGTEFGRDMVHPNLWVNSLMSEYDSTVVGDPLNKTEWFVAIGYSDINKVKEDRQKYAPINAEYFKYLRSFSPLWIITDVRFPNEAKAIKDRGGILIRVDRDSDSKDSHVSENELNTYKDWNYVIDNNYSLLELILKVKQIMFKEGIIYE